MAKVEDVVRVTVEPWVDQRGIVESVDGAYNIVRLDSSQHPDDVRELYPNEFVIVCQGCEHDEHEPGQCEVLHIYARGPNDPPGNQGCLCGFEFKTTITNSNEDAGWTVVTPDREEEKTDCEKYEDVLNCAHNAKESLEEVIHDIEDGPMPTNYRKSIGLALGHAAKLATEAQISFIVIEEEDE